MSRAKVSVALLVAIICIGLCYFLRGPVASFDSDKWKKAALGDRNHPVRLEMIDDLLTHYHLKGMTKQKIEELLGKESSDYFRDYDEVYWLGPERGIARIDSEWLCIKFTKDVATAVDVRTD